MSNDVTKINDYAFYNCNVLSQVVLSKALTSIGTNAFTGYTDLTVYCFEDTYAHEYAKKLANVTIKFVRDNYFVTELKTTALSNNSVTFTWKKPNGYDTMSHYIIYKDGVKYDETTSTTYTDINLESGKEYVYGVCGVDNEGIVSEEKSLTITPACTAVKSITLPNNSTNIGGLKPIKLTATMEDSLSKSGSTAKFYYSKDEKEWIPACTANVQSNGVDYVGNWSLAEVETGKYTLRFVFTDKDGGESIKDVKVNVDRTHPTKIDEITILPRETTIILSWQLSAEVATNIYRVYRRAEGETEFELISEIRNRDTITYTDKNAEKGVVYYYYVVGVDEFNQESKAFDIVSAGLIDDTVAPQFIKMTPASNSYIYGKQTFTVTATDNVGITKTELYYSTSMDAPTESWTLIDEHNGSTYSQSVDTTVMPSAEVFIRAKIYDAVGNFSYSTTYRYMCDNVGPQQVKNVECISVGGTIATLSWDNVADKDIAYYIVEQKQADGSFKNISRTNAILGVNLSGLTPETEYTYRVIGYDKYNNRGVASEIITVTTKADTITPKVTRLAPSPGYFKNNIPLSFTTQDDYKVKSLRIEVSTDKKSWSTVKELDAQSQASSYTFNYTLDLTDYKDGSLFVRGFVTDSYGNTTEEGDATCYEYVVDKTASAVPSGVTASAGEAENGSSFVSIEWNAIADDSSFNYFRVYRSTSEDGEYTLLKDNLRTVNTYDNNVEFSSTYYYKVESVDLAGNVSERSKAVQCKVQDDTIVPVILGISPTNGSKISASQNSISVAASDNAKLSNLKIEYKTNTLFSSYTTLKEINGNSKNNCTTTIALPVDTLSSGTEVTIKVTASDSSGNEAEEKTLTYTIDKDAPEVKDIAISKTDDNVFTTTWTTDAEDTLYFYVYKKTASNSSYVLYDSIMVETGKTSYSFTDENVTVADKNVQYKVVAYDNCGNNSGAETEQLGVTGTISPIAQLECQSTVVFGSEYLFDASASKDDTSIVKYTFDFGDGSEVVENSDGKALHVYTAIGTYTIKLEVTDQDGNKSKLTKDITVTTRELVGKVTAKVTDDSGKVMPNTNVYMDLGTANEQCIVTDSKGYATFEVSVGTHTVASYKTDYLPVKQDIAVTSKETVVSLVLVNEPIVTGEFEIHQMTFDEIKAAGIDINAAENRNVVKINVTLMYEATPVQSELYWNGITVISEPIYVNSRNGRRKLTPTVIGGGGSGSFGGGSSGGGGSSTGGGTPVNIQNPTVVYIDVPVEFSYVKEFFDVSLHIVNHSSSDFSLLDNTVTLNVPDGLSLVKTNASEDNATVLINEIAGQTQETIKWVLRGDKAGSYEISADFLGKLSYFNEPVSAKFIADDKIKVQGTNKMEVVIEAEESSKGTVFYYNVVVKNNGSYPCYDFKMISDKGFAQEFISVDEVPTLMYKPLSVLKGGESFRYHYMSSLNNLKAEDSLYGYTSKIVKDFYDSGCNVRVETYPTEYFTKFTADYASSNEDEYTINVVNSKGEPVVGANVNLGGVVKSTDSNGKTVFDTPKENPIKLTITKDGYYEYKRDYYENYCLGSQDTITIYDTSEKCVIASVIENGDNLLEKTAAIDIRNEKNYDFYVNVFGENITSVELYQNNKILNTISKAQFDNTYQLTFSPSVFTTGKDVYVKATVKLADGKIITAEKKLNARVVDSDIFPKFDDGFMINGLSKISFTVPKDTPIIGGQSFSLDYSDMIGGTDSDKSFSVMPKASVKVVEGELLVGINVEASDIEVNKFEKACEKIQDRITNKLDSFKHTLFPKSTVSLSPKGAFAGYVKFGINDFGEVVFTGGSVSLMLGMDAKCDVSLDVYAVPVVVGVSAGLSATSGLDFNVDANSRELSLDFPGLDTEVELGLKAGFGVSVINAGIYGDAGLDLSLNDNNGSFGLDTAKIKGDAGVYFSFVGADYKQGLINGENEFYNRATSNAKKSSLYYAGAECDIDNYIFGNVDKTLAKQIWNGSETTLLNKVNTNAAPQIVLVNGKQIMVYKGSADTSLASNNSKLYYSVYNTNTNSWGSPVAVDSTNQFVDSFELKEINDKVYLTYVQSGKEYTENPSSIVEACSDREIFVTVFDDGTDKFTAPIKLTENNTYDTQSRLTEVNGQPAVVWINNSDNNPFLIDGNNSVCYSMFSNESWKKAEVIAENIGSISDFDAGMLGDNSGAGFVVDNDGDFATIDDKTVKFVSLIDGKISDIESNISCSNVEFTRLGKNNILLWNNKNNIMKTEGVLATPEIFVENVSNGCTNSFSVVASEGGNSAIVYSDTNADNKTSAYVMYYDSETGKYNAPIELVKSENYIEMPCATYVGENLTVAYIDTTATSAEGVITKESSLNCQQFKSGIILSVNAVDIDDKTVVIGKTASISAQLTNIGDTPTHSFTAIVKDSDGNIVATKQIEEQLNSGETKAIDISFAPSEENISESFTVEISDFCSNKTSAKFNFDNCDLYCYAEQLVLNGNNGADVTITNGNSVKSGGKLDIIDSDGNAVYTQKFLPVESDKYVTLRLEDIDKYADSNGFVTFVVSGYANDYNMINNTYKLKLFNYTENNQTVLIGDVDNDGHISVKDITEVQRYIVGCKEFSKESLLAADVNHDGRVDVLDVTAISRYVSMITDKSGYCGLSFSNVLIGDVDNDGYISVKDTTEVQRYIGGYKKLSEESLLAADVNYDGSIDVSDVAAISRYVSLGINKSSYCGLRLIDVISQNEATRWS